MKLRQKTWFQKFTFTSRLDLLFNIVFLLENLCIDFMLLGKHGSSSQRTLHHMVTLERCVHAEDQKVHDIKIMCQHKNNVEETMRILNINILKSIH